MASYDISRRSTSSSRSSAAPPQVHSNGSSSVVSPYNTYSAMVRQLESSPSSTRRAHTLHKQNRFITSSSSATSNGNGHGGGGGGKHYSLHLNNISSSSPSPANSTFDSALPERHGSRTSTDYSATYQQAPPPLQVHYHHHHHQQQQQQQQQQHQSSPKRPSPTEAQLQQSAKTFSSSRSNRHPSSPDYYDKLTSSSNNNRQHQYNSSSSFQHQNQHHNSSSSSPKVVSTFDRRSQELQDSTYQRIGEPTTIINSRTLNNNNNNNNNNNDNYFSLSEMNDDEVGAGDGVDHGGPPGRQSLGRSEEDGSEDCHSVISRKSATPTERTCDKYGFFLENSEDEEGGGTAAETRVPTSAEVKALRAREKKWLQMLNNWRYYINFKWEKIRDRCRKGIPHSLRSQAWFYLCGGHLQKRRRPALYADLLTRSVPEETRSDITKDLHRQFPGHELFAERSGSGQAELFNVLKAFAAYRPAQGYCQAQGPIAAVLLMHMPAEHAFWSLVALNDYYIGGYFTHNLEEIEIHGRMLAAFLRRFSPSAYSLLKRQNVEPVLYMTEWFMCIYSRSLPWASVLRVWDMFLCEGVTVLFKVGIYIVDVTLRGENVKTCPTMYETCQKLRSTPRHYLAEEPLLKGLKHIDLKDEDLLREHKTQVKKHRKAKSRESREQNAA